MPPRPRRICKAPFTLIHGLMPAVYDAGGAPGVVLFGPAIIATMEAGCQSLTNAEGADNLKTWPGFDYVAAAPTMRRPECHFANDGDGRHGLTLPAESMNRGLAFIGGWELFAG